MDAVQYYEIPSNTVSLPPDIVNDYQESMTMMLEAFRAGTGGEDDTQGHSLSEYGPLRSLEERFIIHAVQRLELLHQVLHDPTNAHHRAIAAMVLGYVQNKAGIVDDLVWAALDPANAVRNNATRALGVMTAYAIARARGWSSRYRRNRL